MPMQKITSSTIPYATFSHAIHAHYQTVLKACPAELVNLFASSQAGATGQLEWWTPLPGRVIPFAQLSVVQQQQLRKTLTERQSALAEVITQLTHTDANTAAVLQQLKSALDVNCLYSINDQPVLVNWYTYYPATDTEAQSTVYVAADNAAVAMSASAARTAALKQAQPSRQWLWWLAVLALLALALALLW